MANPFYSKPEAAQTRRLQCSGVSSIPVGHAIKVTDWPVSSTDTGSAVVCPDGEAPHMFVETDLSDVGTSGVGSFAARDGVRVRAGGSFAADDYLKVSGGRLVKASTGNTAFYQALTPAAGANDLPLARFVGKTTVP